MAAPVQTTINPAIYTDSEVMTPIKFDYVPCKTEGEFKYIVMDKNQDVGFTRIKHCPLINCIPNEYMTLLKNGIDLPVPFFDADGKFNMKEEKIYFIDYFLIGEKYRRKGFASALLKKIIQEYGNQDIYLTFDSTLTDFDILNKFYSKFGFKIIYEWFDYGKNRNAIMHRPVWGEDVAY